MKLIYIDDVIDTFVGLLLERQTPPEPGDFAQAGPVYSTTVGEVAATLRDFAESRNNLMLPRLETGLVRALYSTYASYILPEKFSYQIPRHSDARGDFAEVLKTAGCGQISYFTAHPGVTRGNHYHHSKTETFIVVHGTARFAFCHITTGEIQEIIVRGGEAKVVEAVPGWAHKVTNIGEDDLVVLLWANEAYDEQRPDTVSMQVKA
jgi:UDP-2-acetamido-2,6-beta-L-arabino-hexul-4-ose reductase